MMQRRLALPILALALPVLLLAPASLAQRGSRQSPKLENLSFAEESFESRSMDREMPYGIFLPKDYGEKGNDKTYPLVIYLHGMFEDHMRFAVRGGGKILDKIGLLD